MKKKLFFTIGLIFLIYAGAICQDKTVILHFQNVINPLTLRITYQMQNVYDDFINIESDTTCIIEIDEFGKHKGIPFFSFTISDEDEDYKEIIEAWSLKNGETELFFDFKSIYTAIKSDELLREKIFNDKYNEYYYPEMKEMIAKTDSSIKGKDYEQIKKALIELGFWEKPDRESFDYFDYFKFMRSDDGWATALSYQVRIWGLKENTIQKYEVSGSISFWLKNRNIYHKVKADE